MKVFGSETFGPIWTGGGLCFSLGPGCDRGGGLTPLRPQLGDRMVISVKYPGLVPRDHISDGPLHPFGFQGLYKAFPRPTFCMTDQIPCVSPAVDLDPPGSWSAPVQ